MDGYALFLNTAGLLTVKNYLTGELRFSLSMASSQYAAFAGRDMLVIGRSVFGMNTMNTTLKMMQTQTTPQKSNIACCKNY
jgi:hypothetical protein